MKRHLYIVCIFSLLGILTWNCSTKKNKFANRQYHNITSHFNGYYWAEESIKDGVFKIETAHKDDFNKLIPLFIHPTEEEAKSVYAEMDRAIKKSSLVIQRHAIVDKKGKEIPGAVRWIDENYMCIGQGHFYKRDFFSAIEVFDYVSKVYLKSPTHYKAMLWLIRTYNEMGSVSMSSQLIDMINADKDFPSTLKGELAALTADYLIKRGMYNDAAEQITKAIAMTKSKKSRIRYSFVLAQLYERMEDNKKAGYYYDHVAAMNPTSYDLLFAAKINRARLFDADSDGKTIKRTLAKMAKDPKNKEYLDQIYYTYATIEEKQNNIPAAIDYLKMSVSASVSNTNQKAISFLKLADIYFEKADYDKADKYYDSTVVFLTKEYPNYDQIVNKKTSLNNLIRNLKIIILEDSLQKLAKMTESDRLAAIDKIIANVEAEEKRKQEEEEEKANSLLNNTTSTNNFSQGAPGNTIGGNGMWYFYNPTTVSMGLADFNKKWGNNRKLEDNWRRGNKESTDFGGDPAVTVDETTGKTIKTFAAKELKTREYYLKDIPLTSEMLQKSNGKILEAYNNAGGIYKEELLNNKKSIETFETLIQRFPKNKYELSSYYQLYRLHLSLDNKEKAEYYKKLILSDYADSEYARIIKNPDYVKTAMANKNVVEQYYNSTYEMYLNGNYTEVIKRCDYADTAYFKNQLMPKFDFLRALAIGRSQDVKSFERALTSVIIKNPKEDQIKIKVQELLDFIRQTGQTGNDTTKTAAVTLPDTLKNTAEKFLFDENAEYYWVIVINKGDVNKFKTALSNFNAENYSIANLQISATFLDNDNQLIYVKSFMGKDKAMDYYSFTLNAENLFADLEENTFSTFVISLANYQALYKNKKLDDYMAFFNENY